MRLKINPFCPYWVPSHRFHPSGYVHTLRLKLLQLVFRQSSSLYDLSPRHTHCQQVTGYFQTFRQFTFRHSFCHSFRHSFSTPFFHSSFLIKLSGISIHSSSTWIYKPCYLLTFYKVVDAILQFCPKIHFFIGNAKEIRDFL